MEQMFMEHTEVMVKYPSGMKMAATAIMPTRDPTAAIEVYWLYGDPGTGKSYSARNAISSYCQLTTMEGVQYWDEYQGEACVIMEEFVGGIPLSTLLSIWAEGRPRVRVLGGTVPMCATKFIVCSNVPPWECYRRCSSVRRRAFARRITKCWKFTGADHLSAEVKWMDHLSPEVWTSTEGEYDGQLIEASEHLYLTEGERLQALELMFSTEIPAVPAVPIADINSQVFCADTDSE